MFPTLSRGFAAHLVRGVLLPLIALCASATASAAVDPSELLPVDQVFVLNVTAYNLVRMRSLGQLRLRAAG